MPDFSRRSNRPEMMDDLAVGGAEVERALAALRRVNRLLGGYRVTLRTLARVPTDREAPLRIVDCGAGPGDHAVEIVRWAERSGRRVHITAVEANSSIVRLGEAYRDRHLPVTLRDHIRFVECDALTMPFERDAFDIALASLFLHHFDDPSAVALLREMNRVARRAVLVNDLHRHRLAWLSFHVFSHLFPAPEMFRHDGAVSVLRGFTRRELRTLASRADLAIPEIRWMWAFRWSMASIRDRHA